MSSTSSRPQNPPAARESDPPARTFLKGGDLDREKVCYSLSLILHILGLPSPPSSVHQRRKSSCVRAI